MKAIKNRLFDITVITVLILVFTLLFGYMFGMIRELHAMDLYHHSAKELGSEFDFNIEDCKGIDPEITKNTEMTKAYIEKSMSQSGILCEVNVDYENNVMVCRLLLDGVADAVAEGNDTRWQEVCSVANKTSGKWQECLESTGLEGWHFSVIIVNDYYPKNALAVSTDGNIIYDCHKEISSSYI